MSVLPSQAKTDNSVHLTDRFSCEELIALAVSRVEEAVQFYGKVDCVAGALSGGHDSITACYIASRTRGFSKMFHCDTGVGLEATEFFVAQTCLALGWPLKTYKATENTQANGKTDPMDYFAMLETNGFPGPGQHGTMYIKLKERQIRRFVRDEKRAGARRVLLVSGVRRQESAVRSSEDRTQWHRREGAQIWANPLLDFSKLDCSRIMQFAGLPRSPVVDLIHKSGECLCGAFAKPGELAETTLWFKDDPTIVRLNEAHHRLLTERGWGWGGRPPKKNCLVKAAGQMCSSCTL